MEYQKAVKQVETNAAQRGITNSGIEVGSINSMTYQNAEARAKIRTEGKQKVTEQQLGFLGVGLGQGAQMLTNVNSAAYNANNAYGNATNSFTNTSANYLNQYNTLSKRNDKYIDDMNSAIGLFAGVK
jgi:hypothetical protein